MQPLSALDALPFLQALGGMPVTANASFAKWQGGFTNITYHIGSPTTSNNSVRVRINNVMNITIAPIYNVIATINGAMEPDRQVIMGNHRDAWVFGAVDPHEGTAILLELARTFSVLLTRGWKPSRTLRLCSWDAEEYALIGSTEFVEENIDELSDQAVAYINVDVAVTGLNLTCESSPSLARLIRSVSDLVYDSRVGMSVGAYWSSIDPSRTVGGLGSGSDYTPFLQFAGISSLSLEFTGDYGVYHSIYDSNHYVTSQYQAAGLNVLAQMWGLIALNLTSANILPFNMTEYAQEISIHQQLLVQEVDRRASHST